MFSTDLMESRQERVAINGVEPQMIGQLVSYAYTAEVVISKANVQALLAAANLLDVMAVREACCRFMERQMDEINCVGIHCFAEAHSCKELERCSMEYIQQHFSTVCQQVGPVSSLLTLFLLLKLAPPPIQNKYATPFKRQIVSTKAVDLKTQASSLFVLKLLLILQAAEGWKNDRPLL